MIERKFKEGGICSLLPSIVVFLVLLGGVVLFLTGVWPDAEKVKDAVDFSVTLEVNVGELIGAVLLGFASVVAAMSYAVRGYFGKPTDGETPPKPQTGGGGTGETKGAPKMPEAPNSQEPAAEREQQEATLRASEEAAARAEKSATEAAAAANRAREAADEAKTAAAARNSIVDLYGGTETEMSPLAGG